MFKERLWSESCGQESKMQAGQRTLLRRPQGTNKLRINSTVVPLQFSSNIRRRQIRRRLSGVINRSLKEIPSPVALRVRRTMRNTVDITAAARMMLKVTCCFTMLLRGASEGSQKGW